MAPNFRPGKFTGVQYAIFVFLLYYILSITV